MRYNKYAIAKSCFLAVISTSYDVFPVVVPIIDHRYFYYYGKSVVSFFGVGRYRALLLGMGLITAES